MLFVAFKNTCQSNFPHGMESMGTVGFSRISTRKTQSYLSRSHVCIAGCNNNKFARD